VFVDHYYSTGWYGQPYDWNPTPTSHSTDLDYAIQDIVSVFTDDNRRALGRLVPRDGKVNIYTEGNYSYSMDADSFYDLYKDGAENVHTDSYTVQRVEQKDNGDVRILAKHEYTDPWDQHQVVYHTYYLVRDGRDYVIREFGTSYYKQGW
jgi:hypothetical protein